jgi:hypothetical protein
MNKYIVTTTISEPTTATRAFAQIPGWTLIVVGDIKTPHSAYKSLDCIYIHPEEQESKYKEVSDAIGWKSIQRRNIGFLEAFNLGADVVATVDDDNIPYENWGQDLFVGKEIECDTWRPERDVFDPLSVTKSNHVWHRGYPIDYVPDRLKVDFVGKTLRKVLVQADLWDGDPDIDALSRLSYRPLVKFAEICSPYCSSAISPFNSQNTFLSREVLPFYAVLPHIGRMDDIWGSYILQYYFPNSVIYNSASVYQQRNPQDLITNLENEILGYRNTLKLLQNLSKFYEFLPESTMRFLRSYKSFFQSVGVESFPEIRD